MSSFEVVARGTYRYGGTDYEVVDCGAGGNCLFLSMAFLLRHYGLATVTHHQLRQFAAAQMLAWSSDFPGNLSADLEPGLLEAVMMLRDGAWGSVTSIQAIVQHYSGTGPHFDVHVLGPDEPDDVRVVTDPNHAPAASIHLLYSGYNHYRALIPVARMNRVPPEMRSVGVRPGVGPKPTGEKLKELSVLESASMLEIHHIDVGQGDATLILVRDAWKAIRYSLLIDTGRTGLQVKAYFNQLIRRGDFRPLDAFVATHYDSDHIGGASFLFTPEYLQKDVVFYDLGVPLNPDTDYTNYSLIDVVQSKRAVLPLTTPLFDRLGIRLRCLAYNGIMASSKPGHFWSLSENTDVANSQSGNHIPKDKNACSAALLLEFGHFRYFTAGDLCGYYEELLAHYMKFFLEEDWHVCAWKLGHHGAAEASSALVLKELRPSFGVISCGRDNGFGHPAQDTIDRLEAFNQVYPCRYHITAKVVPATGEKLSIGVLPQSGNHRDQQGTIIIRVTADEAKAHAFSVSSSANLGSQKLRCGSRPYDKKMNLDIGPKKTAKRNRTQAGLDKSEGRQKKRIGVVADAVGPLLHPFISANADTVLADPLITKQFTRISRKYRSNYGEKEAAKRARQTVLDQLSARNIRSFSGVTELEAFLKRI